VVSEREAKGAPKFKMIAMYPANLKKMNRHYHCSSVQRTGCNAHLELTVNVEKGEVTWVLKGGHTKECTSRNGISALLTAKMGCLAQDLYNSYLLGSQLITSLLPTYQVFW
jgi:hypothetical protein